LAAYLAALPAEADIIVFVIVPDRPSSIVAAEPES
jgi:hypothetical protein